MVVIPVVDSPAEGGIHCPILRPQGTRIRGICRPTSGRRLKLPAQLPSALQ